MKLFKKKAKFPKVSKTLTSEEMYGSYNPVIPEVQPIQNSKPIKEKKVKEGRKIKVKKEKKVKIKTPKVPRVKGTRIERMRLKEWERGKYLRVGENIDNKKLMLEMN